MKSRRRSARAAAGSPACSDEEGGKRSDPARPPRPAKPQTRYGVQAFVFACQTKWAHTNNLFSHVTQATTRVRQNWKTNLTSELPFIVRLPFAVLLGAVRLLPGARVFPAAAGAPPGRPDGARAAAPEARGRRADAETPRRLQPVRRARALGRRTSRTRRLGAARRWRRRRGAARRGRERAPRRGRWHPTEPRGVQTQHFDGPRWGWRILTSAHVLCSAAFVLARDGRSGGARSAVRDWRRRRCGWGGKAGVGSGECEQLGKVNSSGQCVVERNTAELMKAIASDLAQSALLETMFQVNHCLGFCKNNCGCYELFGLRCLRESVKRTEAIVFVASMVNFRVFIWLRSFTACYFCFGIPLCQWVQMDARGQNTTAYRTDLSLPRSVSFLCAQGELGRFVRGGGNVRCTWNKLQCVTAGLRTQLTQPAAVRNTRFQSSNSLCLLRPF